MLFTVGQAKLVFFVSRSCFSRKLIKATSILKCEVCRLLITSKKLLGAFSNFVTPLLGSLIKLREFSALKIFGLFLSKKGKKNFLLSRTKALNLKTSRHVIIRCCELLFIKSRLYL